MFQFSSALADDNQLNAVPNIGLGFGSEWPDETSQLQQAPFLNLPQYSAGDRAQLYSTDGGYAAASATGGNVSHNAESLYIPPDATQAVYPMQYYQQQPSSNILSSAIPSPSALSSISDPSRSGNSFDAGVVSSVPSSSSSGRSDIGAINSKTIQKASRKTKTSQQKRLNQNQIEKRYRININSKIDALKQMVPWISKDGVLFETKKDSAKEKTNNDNKPEPDRKLNKTMILDMAMDYIRYLENEIKQKDEIIAKLQ